MSLNRGFFKSRRRPASSREVREAIIHYLIHSKDACQQASTSLPDETKLQDDLGMDSMDIVELVVHLEKKFGIDFDQANDIPKLDTLGTLTEFTYRLATKE